MGKPLAARRESILKRDMDLIRELLLKLEALDTQPGSIWHFSGDDAEVSVPGYTADAIEYHAQLITKAGLIDAGGRGSMQGFMFRSLTWEGHDFLDSIRDPEIWAKTKTGAAAAGGFTVDLLKDLAKGFVKKQIEDLTGVKL